MAKQEQETIQGVSCDAGQAVIPWKIDDNDELPLAVIRDDEYGEGVAEFGARVFNNCANAELLVQEHNQKLELLRACVAARSALAVHVFQTGKPGTWATGLDDLLALAVRAAFGGPSLRDALVECAIPRSLFRPNRGTGELEKVE